MFKKQAFENNIYMKLFRWAYIILIGNLCFLLVNSPFFLVAITTAIDSRNILLFSLALLFFIPSSLTVIAWLNKWREEKDIEPAKQFFMLYRLVWRKSISLGGIGWLVSLIAGMDILFFLRLSSGKWFIPFFFILILMALSVSINNFYFQVRNPQLKSKIIYKTSFYFSLKKWYVSLLNTILLLAVPILMLVKPQFGFLVTPVIFFGAIYLNCLQMTKSLRTV
ncbi:hypothetical protein IGI37_001953 [Enterococcus sp. AZ194]|uniref:DUF624 domain-containing protein n=1 Tax=Enterococcus sp. AZ194 TaxID=2774629 RepID=UPI003F1F4A9D